VRKLPKYHQDTLRHLIVHLSTIANNAHVNKMDSRNLAMIFGPSIVRSTGDNMHIMVHHMSDQCKLVETMINYVSA
jgi:hypothetical protein